jgi:hypothetical protein
MINMFTEWFVQQGVNYINLGMDFGKPILRVAKVALRPVNFFRKYTIQPSLDAETILLEPASRAQ